MKKKEVILRLMVLGISSAILFTTPATISAMEIMSETQTEDILDTELSAEFEEKNVETILYNKAANETSSIADENGFVIKDGDTTPITNPFTDVSDSMYYYQPVLWALENNVTAGISETKFAPEQSCARGQVVTFLWRAMGQPEPTTTTNPFVDVNSNEYYYKAVLWALENGITAGTDVTHFAPNDTVTRGQFVTFLHRAENKPSYSVSNPFSDVPNMYYYDAVLWAYENGVTAGTDSTHFSPEAFCTRGQVVTFLYRALKEDNNIVEDKSLVAKLDIAKNTNQIILVEANGNRATVSMHEKQVDTWKEIINTTGYIGKNGIGKTAEGDKKTPTGVYHFLFAFGIEKNPGTAMKYTQVDDSYYWVDDSNSAYYNQFVSTNTVRKDWKSAEHIVDYKTAYRYVLALDYNVECISGVGSAIFLHCSSAKPTAGCIAVPESDMIKILQNVQENCVVIIDSGENLLNY